MLPPVRKPRLESLNQERGRNLGIENAWTSVTSFLGAGRLLGTMAERQKRAIGVYAYREAPWPYAVVVLLVTGMHIIDYALHKAKKCCRIQQEGILLT